MCFIKFVFAASLVIIVVAPVAEANDFFDRLQDTIERAVEGETNRKADELTRKAMRCLYGDTECFDKAEREGRKVVVVYDSNQKATHGR